MKIIIGKKALTRREIVLWLFVLAFLLFFIFFAKGIRESLTDNINNIFKFLNFH